MALNNARAWSAQTARARTDGWSKPLANVRYWWKADIADAGSLPLAGQMTSAGKRVRRRECDVLRIDLGDGRRSYAQVAAEPLIVFFDGAYTEDLAPERAARLPVLFRIWVMNRAVTRGLWPVIGRQALAPENEREPFFFKQDAVTGGLALYHSSFASTNWQRAATLPECEGLEHAAVWGPEHVLDRLRDYYAGRPNKWLDSLSINRAALS
jgi:hypothetical protein